jgi:hypothetical protein
LKIWHTNSGYSVTCVLAGRSNVFLLSGNGKAILIDTSPGYRLFLPSHGTADKSDLVKREYQKRT